MKINQALHGTALMVLSAAAFSLMGVQVRLLMPYITAGQSLCVRSVISTLVIILLIQWKKNSYLGQYRKELLFRGVIGAFSAAGYFYAVAFGPLAEVVGLYRSAALYMPLVAYILLKEKIWISRIIYSLVGFAGVCLVLKPGFKLIGPGPWIALFGAILNAIAWASVRSLSNKESALTIMLYFSVCSSVLSFCFFYHDFNLPDLNQAVLLISMSLFGLLGQLFLTWSFRYGDASLLAPVGYSEVVFMTIFGWYFYAEIPDLSASLGILFIAAAVFMISGADRYFIYKRLAK